MLARRHSIHIQDYLPPVPVNVAFNQILMVPRHNVDGITPNSLTTFGILTKAIYQWGTSGAEHAHFKCHFNGRKKEKCTPRNDEKKKIKMLGLSEAKAPTRRPSLHQQPDAKKSENAGPQIWSNLCREWRNGLELAEGYGERQKH